MEILRSFQLRNYLLFMSKMICAPCDERARVLDPEICLVDFHQAWPGPWSLEGIACVWLSSLITVDIQIYYSLGSVMGEWAP